MIQGLHTIWCQVSDMDRSVAFYRDILGLKPTYTTPYWSQFDLGNGQLGLHPKLEGAQDPLATFGKGWFLGLKTDDIQALRSTLEGAGVKVHGDYHDVPGGTVLDFEDPDGNTLEAIQLGITAKDL